MADKNINGIVDNLTKPSASVRRFVDLINGAVGSKQGYSIDPNSNKIKIGDSLFDITKEQQRKLAELGYEPQGHGNYTTLIQVEPHSKYREKKWNR